jgi:phosphohistidine phosphatase
MHQLHLLRHAKSSWDDDADDHERPLNKRGREAARLIGANLPQAIDAPDLVLCSTALRTRETAKLALGGFRKAPRFLFEDGIYLASASKLLQRLRELEESTGSVMVIGHNPGLHDAAEFLIAAGDVTLREGLREKFPTGALAVIDFAVDAWNRIHDHSGRLDRYVTPRSIAAATN